MALVEIYFEILAALVYVQGVAGCGLTIYVWKYDRWPTPKDFVALESFAAFIVVGIYAIEFIVQIPHYFGY